MTPKYASSPGRAWSTFRSPTDPHRRAALWPAPRTAPFSVRLADFHKTDYPGTEMAMAYQSDVGIQIDGQPEIPYQIYMNNPFVHGPWKVYQSGFMGEKTSIFSVMHNPGLLLTYIASVVLCVASSSRSIAGR